VYKRSAVAETGNRLATIDMGRKGRGCCAPFGWGDLGPHLTQYGLRRGLPPYQVASRSIQPFDHNIHGPKIGGCVPFGRAESPSNTMSPGPRPTSVPNGILIYSAICHNRRGPKIGEGLCPFGWQQGPHLTQSRLGRDLPPQLAS